MSKEAFSHLKVLLAGSTGVLRTAGPCPQLGRPFSLSTDRCRLSSVTEIGYWGLWLVKAVEYFLQDGLAESWQAEMCS